VRYKAHGASENEVTNATFPVHGNLTGQALIGMIEQKQLHRYRYNALGSGCLTWSQHIITKLVAEGLLQDNAERIMIEAIVVIRLTNNGYWVPYEFGACFNLPPWMS
jgi:hypothetical protein